MIRKDHSHEDWRQVLKFVINPKLFRLLTKLKIII